MSLWGSLVSSWSFPPMHESQQPLESLTHPKGNRLPLLAIYEQLLEKARSKSHISPWEQKWGADGGVNSQPWATFEIFQPLGSSHCCALCWATNSYRIYCFLHGAPLADIKETSTQSSPSATGPQATVQSKHPFSLFWFSQTCRTILRNPVSGLII